MTAPKTPGHWGPEAAAQVPTPDSPPQTKDHNTTIGGSVFLPAPPPPRSPPVEHPDIWNDDCERQANMHFFLVEKFPSNTQEGRDVGPLPSWQDTSGEFYASLCLGCSELLVGLDGLASGISEREREADLLLPFTVHLASRKQSRWVAWGQSKGQNMDTKSMCVTELELGRMGNITKWSAHSI